METPPWLSPTGLPLVGSQRRAIGEVRARRRAIGGDHTPRRADRRTDGPLHAPGRHATAAGRHRHRPTASAADSKAPRERHAPLRAGRRVPDSSQDGAGRTGARRTRSPRREGQEVGGRGGALKLTRRPSNPGAVSMYRLEESRRSAAQGKRGQRAGGAGGSEGKRGRADGRPGARTRVWGAASRRGG